MQYPNKTYLLETKTQRKFGTSIHIIIVTAVDAETAAQHLKDKLGFDGVANDLIWLMNTNHITLYDQTGNKELPVQARILYRQYTQ